MMSQDPKGNADEQILAVRTDWLPSLGLRSGFDPDPMRLLGALRAEDVSSLSRARAEEDPRFKQLICYVIFRRGGAIFHYRRSAQAGEKRLAGRRSVGLGGHLNAADAGGQFGPDTLRRAIERELTEEAILDDVPSVHYLGIINEDTSAVSQVHLGIVAVAEIGSAAITLRDSTLTEGRFDHLADLLGLWDEFEGWSQLCFRGLGLIRPEFFSRSHQQLGQW